MYTRILVPLDGSAESAQALPYAQLIAHATGVRMELFEAAPGLDALMRGWMVGDSVGANAVTLSFEQWQELQNRYKQAAQSNLDSAAKRLQATGLRVKTILGEGDPAEAITSEAEREPGTLIAMATHGRSGIARWNMGSVADKVVRAGGHPTLLVRTRKDAPAAATLCGIVLPLDGSDLSAAAIPHAAALAKTLGIGVQVLNCVQAPYFEASRYSHPEVLMQQTRLAEQQGQEYVNGVADRLRAEGIGHAEGSAVCADPASAILHAVGETGDQLVIISTHGRGGLGRMLLGSVTDKVVRHSDGPVLVIRPKQD